MRALHILTQKLKSSFIVFLGVVGRIEKRKTNECADAECVSAVYHFYPVGEYNKEYNRLNKPSMVKEFEKTIIIRENGKTFRRQKPR